MLLSVVAALYTYIMFFYMQNTSSTPPKWMKDAFLWFNILMAAVQIITTVVAAATNELFFLGLNSQILFPLHQFTVCVVWNLALHKLHEAIVNSCPDPQMYGAVLRRTWYLRLVANVFTPSIIVYEEGLLDNTTDWLTAGWGRPLPEANANVWLFVTFLSPVTKIVVHSALYWALHKPSTKEHPKYRHRLASSLGSTSPHADTSKTRSLSAQVSSTATELPELSTL